MGMINSLAPLDKARLLVRSFVLTARHYSAQARQSIDSSRKATDEYSKSLHGENFRYFVGLRRQEIKAARLVSRLFELDGKSKKRNGKVAITRELPSPEFQRAIFNDPTVQKCWRRGMTWEATVCALVTDKECLAAELIEAKSKLPLQFVVPL